MEGEREALTRSKVSDANVLPISSHFATPLQAFMRGEEAVWSSLWKEVRACH